MRKILIISYFFPPCNLTASHRTLGWARYLKEFGYYPIIVTRNWEHPVNMPQDMARKAGSSIIHEMKEDYEVYYLPYKPSLRDKIYVQYGNRFSVLRKALSLLELTLQYFFLFIVPFSNIYFFSKQLLQQQRDIKLLIVTANPFVCFRFGYLLNKKCSLPWIADYRDDWNTGELSYSKNLFSYLLKKLSAYYEKKWVSSASHITTVSRLYANKLYQFTSVPSTLIINGFFDKNNADGQPDLFSEFTITYSGTLYASQPVELFLNAIKFLIDKHNRNIKIKILFMGTGFDPVQKLRVQQIMAGYESFYEITNRIEHQKAILIQECSHILLMMAHKGIKGIPSSKIYEYIAMKKPVILYPTDGDVIEKTLSDAGVGIFPASETELLTCLEDLYEKYIQQKPLTGAIDENRIQQFSRKASTYKLSLLLDNLSTP